MEPARAGMASRPTPHRRAHHPTRTGHLPGFNRTLRHLSLVGIAGKGFEPSSPDCTSGDLPVGRTLSIRARRATGTYRRGVAGARTPGLRYAIPTLFQLSYNPMKPDSVVLYKPHHRATVDRGIPISATLLPPPVCDASSGTSGTGESNPALPAPKAGPVTKPVVPECASRGAAQWCDDANAGTMRFLGAGPAHQTVVRDPARDQNAIHCGVLKPQSQSTRPGR